MLTYRGTEGWQDKFQVVIDMTILLHEGEIQKLVGLIPTLSQFLSRAADRSHPVYQLLQKNDTFSWNDWGLETFKHLKQYFTTPLVSISHIQKKTLILYQALSKNSRNSVLVQKKENEECPATS